MKSVKLFLAILCTIMGIFEIYFLWCSIEYTLSLIALATGMTLGISFAASVLWFYYLDHDNE